MRRSGAAVESSSVCSAMRRNRTKPAVAVLPPDMLANIHSRLTLLDRLAFAAVFRASRDAFKPEAPWLVLPGDTPERATLFSLADRRTTVLRSTGTDHVVLGSSAGGGGGWLVTADDRAQMHLLNPVTGEQHLLPDITTMPCIFKSSGARGVFFTLGLNQLVRGPPYPGRPSQGGFTLSAEAVRHYLYRKVILSDSSPRPATMLITSPMFGVAAFAMEHDGVWRLAAPSCDDGVEDAIYYEGKFYSLTYSGAVEVWEQNTDSGEFTSTVLTPGLLTDAYRKYLVAAPDGRLMVVLKDSEETMDGYRYCRRGWMSFFKVLVPDGEPGGQWKETDDIGDAALFVGVNNSLCVSTREHPELRAGCVYYTGDDLRPCKHARHRHEDDPRGVGVFHLKDGRVEEVEGLGLHGSWPPPAWFTPYIP